MDSIILKVKNIYSTRKKKKQKQKEEEKKNAFNLIFSNSNGGDQCQPADAVVFIAYLVRNPRENISSGFLSFLTTDQRELSLYDSRWFHTCAEQQFIFSFLYTNTRTHLNINFPQKIYDTVFLHIAFS